MSLNLTRMAKRARTSAAQPAQPMLNPLAMMMMNPALAQMNQIMNPMSAMPQTVPMLAPVQDDDSADDEEMEAAPPSMGGNAGSLAIPAVLPAAAVPVPAEDLIQQM